MNNNSEIHQEPMPEKRFADVANTFSRGCAIANLSVQPKVMGRPGHSQEHVASTSHPTSSGESSGAELICDVACVWSPTAVLSDTLNPALFPNSPMQNRFHFTEVCPMTFGRQISI